MWPFRRRRPPRPETLADLAPLKPRPTVGTADYQLPESDRKDQTMSDENPDNVSAGPYGGDDPREPNPADPTPLRFADPDNPGRVIAFDPDLGVVRSVPVADTGSHHWQAPPPASEPMQFHLDGTPDRGYTVDDVATQEADREVSQPLTPAAYANPDRPDCPHCHGTGKVLTTSDLLRASLALLGTDPRELDHFVAEFYARLLDLAPDLAPLFPADLVDANADPDGGGKGQRDKLLNALIALGTSYDPEDSEKMRLLDQELARFGRAHAAFPSARGNGSAVGATLEEYHAVKVVLFNLLHDVVGEAWRGEYDDAWSEAYDYAAAAMMFSGQRHALGRQLFPRTTRQ